MRVASLDFPDLALQLALRDRGLGQTSPAAISAMVAGRELVVSVTRAAREGGARPGQTAAQARALVPRLAVLPAPFRQAGQTLGALAEALSTLSPAVELSPPEGLLLDASTARFVASEAGDLPAGWPRQQRQEQAWAEATLSLVRSFGLAGRLAVADTPVSARLVAASLTQEPVRTVPPGHQLAALCGVSWRLVEQLVAATALQLPRMALADAGPELLPVLASTVFRDLEDLGIRRVGRLLELPPRTVVERFGRDGEQLVLLARAGRARPLVGHRPVAALVELVAFEPGLEETGALVFALRPAAERLAARLAGRGLAATKLLLRLETEVRDDEGAADAPAVSQALPRPMAQAGLPPPRRRHEKLLLAFARPTTQARLFTDLLRDRLDAWRGLAPVLRAGLEVVEMATRRDQLSLGERPRVTEGLESVLARLKGRLGEDAVGSPHARPDFVSERATGLAPFRPAPATWRGRDSGTQEFPTLEGLAGEDALGGLPSVPLRQWPPQEALLDRDASGRVRGLLWQGRRHRVLAWTAPERLSTGWWAQGVVRDYQTLLLDDGARVWGFQDPQGRWWVQGIYD